MKAIVYRKYGSPEELQLSEIEKPVPNDHEILVKVHAASVNSWDWDLLLGKPLIYRLMFGIFKPKYPVIGSDIAGRVVEVGAKVTDFKVGDDVFGDLSGNGFGAFAEYASARAMVMALKPANITFATAAAIPQAGILALQGLHHRGNIIAKGQKILINGAGGGVGTFAIQIAKTFGAEVTAVDSSLKQELMRSLGADHVIDYAKEDFTKMANRYDLVLDMVFNRPVAHAKSILNPGGKYVIIGGEPGRLFKLMIGGIFAKNPKKSVSVLMYKPNRKDLVFLLRLIDEGRIKPVIEKRFPLNQTADAVRHLGQMKAQGKIVISI